MDKAERQETGRGDVSYQAWRRLHALSARNPADVEPDTLTDSEMLYQVWRCLYSIRALLIFWLLTGIIAAIVWAVILNDWTSRSRF